MSYPTRYESIGKRLFLASLSAGVVCCVVATPRLRGLLLNSAFLAGGAIAISLPLGTFLAVAIGKTSLPGRAAVWRLMLALLFVPLFVQAAGWQAAVGRTGWLATTDAFGGWLAAIWVHGIAGTAWVVLFVVAALKNVPRELEEEALQHANAAQVLWRVTLRRALAGVVAAALWITVVCFGEITVTDLFQVRTFAEEVYTAASLGGLDLQTDAANIDVAELAAADLWLGSAVMVCLVVAALATVWVWLPVTNFVSPAEGWIWRLRRGRWPLAVVVWLLTAVVVGAPAVSLLGKCGAQVTRTGDTIVREWSSAKATKMLLSSPWEHRRELRWSLTIGSIAAGAATAMGVLLAWALRTRRLPAAPVAMLLAIGFSIPGPLLGVWLIRLLNQPADSSLALLSWCYDNTILAPVLVQLLRALPLATLFLVAQFATVPQDVLESAASDGAGWIGRLWSIVLPICWPGIVAAGCLSLIVAIGDLAATLLVVPPGVATLSVRIFSLLHYGAEDRVSALCLALALAVGIVATLAWQLLTSFRSQEKQPTRKM